ncbi:MAG: hypothetical protein JAY64_07160 [Candidatus Thiodiazotropha weberae]|nr:hypothetical protein [Candidatus Thiodiazotropha lotti]MCG8011467.1 hypothetical protein [Candidatus Thiodiazotropha lotti]MCW4210932.1 hypothetical protein [Candidatus Thiodiazotropha lotti]MCW4217184.1 hypothetical protein [Candidatus Thiodiazotropha lotti]
MKNLQTTGIIPKALNIWIAVILMFLTIYLINFFSSTNTPPSHIDKLQILTQLFIGSGVFFAGSAYYNSIKRQRIEDDKNQSKVLLDYASENFDRVTNLLRDKNNDRVTWIRAARILLDTSSLKKNITSPEYIKAYEIEEFECRGELYKILCIDGVNGNYDPLPPSFFFGVKDWNTMTIEEAAIEAAGDDVEIIGLSLSSPVPEPKLLELEISSVKAIYDFLDYGKDFKDPLKIISPAWGNNWQKARGHSQGAEMFSYFKRHYNVKNNKVIDALTNKEIADRL